MSQSLRILKKWVFQLGRLLKYSNYPGELGQVWWLSQKTSPKKTAEKKIAKHWIPREIGVLEVDIRPTCPLVRNICDDLIHFFKNAITTVRVYRCWKHFLQLRSLAGFLLQGSVFCYCEGGGLFGFEKSWRERNDGAWRIWQKFKSWGEQNSSWLIRGQPKFQIGGSMGNV